MNNEYNEYNEFGEFPFAGEEELPLGNVALIPPLSKKRSIQKLKVQIDTMQPLSKKRSSLEEGKPPPQKKPKYAVITTTLEELNANNKIPYLKVGNAFLMDETNNKNLLLFEIVEVLDELEYGIKRVRLIDDKTKIYRVPNKYITPFTTIIGQNFKYLPKGIISVKSIDPDNKYNFIVKVNRTGEYLSITQVEMISIKGADSEQDMSYFYSVILDEPITEIETLQTNCLEISQTNCLEISQVMKTFCSSNRITTATNQISQTGPPKFQISDDCYIEYIQKTADTIYIEKFMCSSQVKGTGRNLFCDFLCFIINTFLDIKYITLIAQPHYVSTVRASLKLQTILQKKLNDLYRSLRFYKIDMDNEFMGCISELIEPCLRNITFTDEEDWEERFLNDMQNNGPPTKIRVRFPSFFNMNAFRRVGGSKRKTKKRKSKKRIRRKSIKKNNFFEKKRMGRTKKRRKSIKKRK